MTRSPATNLLRAALIDLNGRSAEPGFCSLPVGDTYNVTAQLLAVQTAKTNPTTHCKSALSPELKAELYLISFWVIYCGVLYLLYVRSQAEGALPFST